MHERAQWTSIHVKLILFPPELRSLHTKLQSLTKSLNRSFRPWFPYLPKYVWTTEIHPHQDSVCRLEWGILHHFNCYIAIFSSVPVSGGATIHYARCRANSAFSFNARVLFVLLGTRLYACCVQWTCMLCTVGLCVVYSRAVCCVQ